MTPLRLTVDELASRIPGPATERWPRGERFAVGLRHGSLLVELYDPGPVDTQQPHTRDEVYVVVSGSGTFEREGERVAFAPHDVLSVPAGAPHRFVDYTPDFRTWVVFYGPEGGEAQEPR
jgi:mannose-6-phosphate isomerase-like protein (cupin superfamily)